MSVSPGASQSDIGERSLEGDEGYDVVQELSLKFVNNPDLPDEAYDTIQTVALCYVNQNADTVAECVSQYSVEISPAEIAGEEDSEDEPGEDEGEPNFEIDGRGDEYIFQPDEGFEVSEVEGEVSFEDGTYSLDPRKGAVYSFLLADTEEGGEEWLDLQAPNFDFRNTEAPVSRAGTEYEVELVEYNGGGEQDPYNMVSQKEFELTTEGSLEPENTDRSQDTGSGPEKAVVDTDTQGVSEVEVEVEDNTPGDGIRISDTKRTLVGEGYTKNLEVSGGSPQRFSSWNVYSRESEGDDLRMNTNWEDWGPTSSDYSSIRQDKGMHIEASNDGTYDKQEVLVNRTLTDDTGTETVLYFAIKDTGGTGEVILRNTDEEERIGSFSPDTDGEWVYYRIDGGETYNTRRATLGQEISVYRAGSFSGILDDPERVEELGSDGDNFNSVGFSTEIDEDSYSQNEVIVRFVATLKGDY